MIEPPCVIAPTITCMKKNEPLKMMDNIWSSSASVVCSNCEYCPVAAAFTATWIVPYSARV
jgi:hypothetical protein